MNSEIMPSPVLEKSFQVEAIVDTPILIGQDSLHGRRQVIRIKDGVVAGNLKGRTLPGGVDTQIIRPNGLIELSARYALILDDGTTVFIENNGIRRVNPDFAADATAG